jgi:hypothetical protein
MARFKIVNGERVQFTAEEETARDEEERQSVIRTQSKIDAQTKNTNDKASGKQKLKDLGLNDDEIKALTGA